MKQRNEGYGLGLLLLCGLFYLFAFGQRPLDKVNADTALRPPPTPTPGPLAKENIELMGHLGGWVQSVNIQNQYVYLGAGSALSVLDITDPTQPQRILKAAYEGAKAADPNATIISAGLAPTETGNGAIRDLDYLDQLYDLGLANYTDVVDMQGLGFQHPPEHDTGSPEYNFNRLKYLYQIMVDQGDQDRPVWALEVGWLRNSPYDMGSFEPFKVSELEQAQYLYRAWQKAENEWPWLETMVFWNLDYDRYYPPTSNFYWYSTANQLAEAYLSLTVPEPAYIGPDLPNSLFYNDLYSYHGYSMPVIFSFPEEAVLKPTVVVLAPVKVTPPPGLTIVGPQVALEIYQNGAQNADFIFTNPIEVRFTYCQLSPITNFEGLSVLWWSGTAWQPATETCSPHTSQSHNLAEHSLIVLACRAGIYLLMGPTQEMYMPLIHH